MLRVELQEWEQIELPGIFLTPRDCQLAEELARGEEGRLTVEELRSGVRITAYSWVGVIRFENFEIRVLPKMADDYLSVVRMIEFTSGLEALKRQPSIRDIETEGASLLDLLALLFAEACERVLRQGLVSDYMEREEDLPVVRGRILADQQILRRFGQIDRIICRYDEYQQNIMENQVLTFTLSLCARRVANESVKRRLRRLLAIFRQVCDPEGLNLKLAKQMMIYNRLNEHYREAHQLAWHLLDGMGIEDVFAPGDVRCFAFLIDMNRLFEQFVYRFVVRALHGAPYRTRYQKSARSIICYASSGLPYARVVPDVLVETVDRPVRRLPIDAKYKLYDERKLAMGDIYQSFLYAYAFRMEDGGHTPMALLIYPSSGGKPTSVRLTIAPGKDRSGADLVAMGLDIPQALAEIESGIAGPTVHSLKDAVQRYLLRQSGQEEAA